MGRRLVDLRDLYVLGLALVGEGLFQQRGAASIFDGFHFCVAVEERVKEFEHVVCSHVLVLVELEHLERLVLLRSGLF